MEAVNIGNAKIWKSSKRFHSSKKPHQKIDRSKPILFHALNKLFLSKTTMMYRVFIPFIHEEFRYSSIITKLEETGLCEVKSLNVHEKKELRKNGTLLCFMKSAANRA